jgi:hypothetical protein
MGDQQRLRRGVAAAEPIEADLLIAQIEFCPD